MKLRSLDSIASRGVSHDPEIAKRVLVAGGEIPALTQLAQARLAPGQRTVAHSHPDMFEVFLVESGNGTVVVDGALHALAPGSCLVVEPGELHHLESSGEADLVVTYFGIAVPDTPAGPEP